MTDRPTLFGGALALIAFFLVAGFGSGYEKQLLTLAGIYAIATLGYQFTFGQAGMLSLAQGAFFGIGAYATGILSASYGLPFWATFAAAIALPSCFAAIVAIPVLRLQSHYFALATLGLAQLVDLTAINWEDMTGGANGIYGVPGIALFGFELSDDTVLMITVWALLLAALAIFKQVTGGTAGLRLTTLRETPTSAALLGIDIGRERLRLFLLSAAFGGAAGALQAHVVGVVSPSTTNFHIMVTILTMAVVGGRGSAVGTIIAAILLVHLPEWLRVLESVYLLAYGALLLVVIIAFPGGLAGLVKKIFPGHQRLSVNPQHSAAYQGGTDGLSVKGLHKEFGGVNAVDGIDLEVRPGQILGIIGPNGSGKTTLVNLITGIEKPNTGTVHLGTHDLTGQPVAAISDAGIGRSLQHPELPSGLSVEEAIAAVNSVRPLEESLQSLAAQSVDDLPPGTRRKVEIARMMARGPKVICLDEPAAGLTETERAELGQYLRELASSGAAILLIEHTMDFLLPLADRVICMDHGLLIAEGSPENIRAHPDVIKTYFGEGAGQ